MQMTEKEFMYVYDLVSREANKNEIEALALQEKMRSFLINELTKLKFDIWTKNQKEKLENSKVALVDK